MKRRLLDDNGLAIDAAVGIGRRDDVAAEPDDEEVTLIGLLRALLTVLNDVYDEEAHALRITE